MAASQQQQQQQFRVLLAPHLRSDVLPSEVNAPPDVFILEPQFSKETDGKVQHGLRTPATNVIQHAGESHAHFTAIANDGIDLATQGTHIFGFKAPFTNNNEHGVVPCGTLDVSKTNYISQFGGSYMYARVKGTFHESLMNVIVAITVNQGTRSCRWIHDGCVTWQKLSDGCLADSVTHLFPAITLYNVKSETRVLTRKEISDYFLHSTVANVARSLRDQKVEIPRDQILLSDGTLNNNFDGVLKAKLKKKTVRIAFFGPPNSAKSSHYNAIASLLNKSLLDVLPRQVGSCNVEGGQFSTAPFCEPASFYLDGTEEWNPQENGDVDIFDMVGFSDSSKNEIEDYGNGKLGDTEPYPRGDRNKQREVEDRPINEDRCITCFVLFVSCTHFMENMGEVMKNNINTIITSAREFTFKGQKIGIPLFVVLTKCDALPDIAPLDLLRQADSPVLQKAFKKFSDTFGFPIDMMLATGWTDDLRHIDFTARTCDPRALVLREIFLKATGAAEQASRRIKMILARANKKG